MLDLRVPVRYAAAYFAAIASLFYLTMKKARVVHWILRVYDQMPWLHQMSWTKRWGDRLTGLVRLLRRQPVCILVKTDEVRFALAFFPCVEGDLGGKNE